MTQFLLTNPNLIFSDFDAQKLFFHMVVMWKFVQSSADSCPNPCQSKQEAFVGPSSKRTLWVKMRSNFQMLKYQAGLVLNFSTNLAVRTGFRHGDF